MHDVTINETNLLGRIGTQRLRQFSPPAEEGQIRPLDGRVLPMTVLEKPTIHDLPELKRLSERLAIFAGSISRDLRFRLDEASGRTVVTVLDGETQEVIRQVPSEELLRLARVHATTTALLFEGEV